MTKSLIMLGMSSRKSRAFCASAYDIFSPERLGLKTGGFCAEGWRTWWEVGRWEEGRLEVGRGEMLTWNLCLSQEGRKKSPPRFSSDHGAPSSSYHLCQKKEIKNISSSTKTLKFRSLVYKTMTLTMILIQALHAISTNFNEICTSHCRWESNINVWFRFMNSQKWNCVASLFPKQNVLLSPNFHTHVSVSNLYIPRISLPILLQPNRQTDPENL